ncbi:hypothetical protein Smp_166610 [Schistosoma mansoni]|uniref:hypothetical protein n=1 Tax=Schistosoma mansoni TaxID=6183 RepID=UPI0001A623AE|nr:hypothetical protein Smp_166610 [Schistosoma mansoni]|eukprot:XP_018644339.1 hypothetical protein Smp_166610 [Schistosoma mansoni]
MPCIRDPFPWWLPLALSCSIVLITIFIGIFRWLYKIYSRHKRLKIRSSRQFIQYKQLSPLSIDNQRTLSLQSTNDDLTDDYPGLFADYKDDQEFDEFTESEENIDSMHKNCSPSRYLISRNKKLRRIKTISSKKPDISTLPIIKINDIHLPHHHHHYQQQQEEQEQQPHKPLLHKSNSVNSSKTPLSDLQSSPSCLETQSDTTYINDFFTVKPTNNHILLSENSTPSYWEESNRCNWFVNWFKYTRLGMSARQQLNMKLYCERFTTVSYPAGKIMVSGNFILNSFFIFLFMMYVFMHIFCT